MTTSLQPLAEARRLAAIAEAKPLRQYREILSRWDNPAPNDATLLAELLKTLVLTDGDVLEDLKWLEEDRSAQTAVTDAAAAIESIPTAEATTAKLEQMDRVLAHKIHLLLADKRALVTLRQKREDAETRHRLARTAATGHRRESDRMFGG